MTAIGIIDRWTAPLDRARRWVFGFAVQAPLLKAVLLRRDQRVSVLASLHGMVALLVAIYAPVFALLVGPILLGVAHVAADVRYLVLRRSLAPWWRHTIAAACAALIALRGLSMLTRVPLRRAEIALTVTWAVLGVVAGAEQHWRLRNTLALLGVLAVGAAAWAWPRQTEMLLLHTHNWIAVVAWLWLFQPRLAAVWPPALIVVVGAAALASGAFAATTLAVGATTFGLHVLQAADWIAPGLSLKYALGVTCAYVFLQSVHYATWLYYIPQQGLAGQAPATFRASGHSLVRDFGVLGGCLVLVVIAGVVVLAAVLNVQVVRHAYLSLATFHVYLEMVLLTYFYSHGGPGGVPLGQDHRPRLSSLAAPQLRAAQRCNSAVS